MTRHRIGKDLAMDCVFLCEGKRVECAARRHQQHTRSEPGDRDQLRNNAGAETLQRIADREGGACSEHPERGTQRNAGGGAGVLRQEAGRMPRGGEDNQQQRSGEHGDGAVERPTRPYQAGRRQRRTQYCNAGHGQGAGCRPQRDRPARNEPVRRLVDKAREHNCSHPNDYQYKKHLIANADRKEEGSAGPS